MDDVPLAGQEAELLAQGLDRVDGGGGLRRLLVLAGFGGDLGGFLGLVVRFGVLVLDGFGGGLGLGLVDNVLVGHVGFGVIGLDVQGSLFGRFARSGVGSLGLVLVGRLDDLELVLDGLDRLDGVVQVRVRHGGCFFLATDGVEHAKGAPIVGAPFADQPKTYLTTCEKPESINVTMPIMMTTNTITTEVYVVSWLRVGQTTLRSSATTCR